MYKIYTNILGMRYWHIPKLFLVTRLTALILLITSVHASASTTAQTISISKSNVNLVEVFSEISKQTGYDFFYSSKQLAEAKKVDINIKNGTIIETLNQCFKEQPFSYAIKNKIITIKRKESPLFESIGARFRVVTITGSVVDTLGKPLSGAIVKIQGKSTTVRTNEQGNFTIISEQDNGVLVISYLGYKTQEIGFTEINLGPFKIKLEQDERRLDEVAIVSTGYQTLEIQKTVGSFDLLDSKLLNRSTSTNILDRLKNVAPGVYFENRDPQLASISRRPNLRNSGIIVRGESSFSGSKEPLIILDNFPYEGEIKNINPNDVESITILKDASSAAIWGARSGNGVIVITTKSGKFNQKQTIQFNSNVTVINKPDIFYSQNFLKSTSYIEVERYLYNQGYFNAQLNNLTSFPTVSPTVELMKAYDLATTDTERNEIQNKLNEFKSKDVREDFEKYVYRNAINQQYTFSIKGGANSINYAVSIGRDKNQDNLIRNGYNRTTINIINTFKPFEKLELMGGLNFSQNVTTSNNGFAYGSYNGIGAPYSKLFPYASLANELGEALPILQGIRTSYLESTTSKGFMDWNYRPLDEIKFSDYTSKVKNLLFKFNAKYKILPQLDAIINYQNQTQTITGSNYRSMETYFVRNLINQFTTYNPSTGVITYNFPKNGILDLEQTALNQNNLRGQLNYNQLFSDHRINILVGSEVGETKVSGFNRTSYGFNKQIGTAVSNLNYGIFYPKNPSGTAVIAAPDGTIFENLNRSISYFAIGSYEYDSRYTLNLTARKDGANLFGAKANDKIQPFISLGLGWNISKESFFNVVWLPYLRLRTTYGFQGNTNQNSSAYLSGVYGVDKDTGAPTLNINTAPNPRLQWENIRNINLGIDFVTIKNKLNGTIEFYKKNARDLIQPTILAPQAGFSSYQANTASTETRGLDITLTSQNVKGDFIWSTTLFFSGIKDKVVRYDVPRTSSSIANSSANYAVGKPLNSLFSYKWAGLNSVNGNPMGFVNGQVSENYLGIINNYNVDSLVFNGSKVPTAYGALRNDFTYKGINLSVNISYRFGYVFRRSSTSLNYTNVIQTNQHSDFDLRWQKPGDENQTNIPSLVYPSNNNRNAFYQSSETLVESGDHIRLQDIRLSFQILPRIYQKGTISNLNFFVIANNLGIIWRKNKFKIDPSAVGYASGSYPIQSSISFGFTANL